MTPEAGTFCAGAAAGWPPADGPPAVRAVVFDLDGVLVDSEPLHVRVTREVLAPVGVAFTRAMNVEFMGRSAAEMLRVLHRRYRLPGRAADYEARYDETLVRLLARPIPPSDGAVWLLDELRRCGVRLGIASSSRYAWVTAMLHALALPDAFDAVVGGDLVARAKPAPDVFLLAAGRLAVPASSCIAVEDSPAGLRAARRAGMTTVGLVTPHIDARRLGLANRLIRSLREFPIDLLRVSAPASRGPGGSAANASLR